MPIVDNKILITKLFLFSSTCQLQISRELNKLLSYKDFEISKDVIYSDARSLSFKQDMTWELPDSPLTRYIHLSS